MKWILKNLKHLDHKQIIQILQSQQPTMIHRLVWMISDKAVDKKRKEIYLVKTFVATTSPIVLHSQPCRSSTLFFWRYSLYQSEKRKEEMLYGANSFQPLFVLPPIL